MTRTVPRRSHKKSRNGCIECKRRHIKCDESRPACSNCITVQRDCQYPPGANRGSAGGVAAPSPSSSSTSPAPTVYDFSGFNPPTLSPSTSNAGTSTSTNELDGSINLLHLELLHQCSSSTFSFWGSPPETVAEAADAIIATALKTPFLMYQLLAFSAQRLHVLHARNAAADGTENSLQKAALYHDASVRLQTQALALVNRVAKPEVDELHNQAALFLFAYLLGVHTFSETLAIRLAPGEDFNVILGRFLHYQMLHRGVRVIGFGSKDYLEQTGLGRMMKKGEVLDNAVGTGPECNAAKYMVERHGERGLLSAANCGALKNALDMVQWAVDARRDRDMERTILMAMTWQLLTQPEVAVMLEDQSPPALVVLAHYAVLLHWCRETWIVGDAGKIWVEAIARFVGEMWGEYMTWPLEEVNTSPLSAGHVGSDHDMQSQ